jgi:hypothetical protein
MWALSKRLYGPWPGAIADFPAGSAARAGFEASFKVALAARLNAQITEAAHQIAADQVVAAESTLLVQPLHTTLHTTLCINKNREALRQRK